MIRCRTRLSRVVRLAAASAASFALLSSVAHAWQWDGSAVVKIATLDVTSGNNYAVRITLAHWLRYCGLPPTPNAPTTGQVWLLQ